MEGLVYNRIVFASITFPSAIAGVVLLVAARGSLGWHAASLLAAALLLGPAQLLRAASVLRRSSTSGRFPGAPRAALALLSMASTALCLVLFVAGFGQDMDDDSRVLGWLLAAVSLALLSQRRGLPWPSFHRDAAHRRVKAKLVSLLTRAAAIGAFCVLLAAWLDASSIFAAAAVARWSASVLVLFSGDLFAELIEDCTSPPLGNLPAEVLKQALLQPLATEGPGLGRWLALTTLAQAVAHRPQGVHPGVCAGSDIGLGLEGNCGSRSLPPLAAEVFALSDSSMQSTSIAGVLQDSSTQPSAANAMKGIPETSSRRFSTAIFPIYLKSGLEVLAEFNVRLQCLQAASQRRGPDTLLPQQVRVLDRGLLELAPLMRVAASGLSGWLCLSRDIDETGVAQREDSLRKVLAELCICLSALKSFWPRAEVLGLSNDCLVELQSAQQEARHGLSQLVLTFENSGLQQVVQHVDFPLPHRRLVTELCQ